MTSAPRARSTPRPNATLANPIPPITFADALPVSARRDDIAQAI